MSNPNVPLYVRVASKSYHSLNEHSLHFSFGKPSKWNFYIEISEFCVKLTQFCFQFWRALLETSPVEIDTNQRSSQDWQLSPLPSLPSKNFDLENCLLIQWVSLSLRSSPSRPLNPRMYTYILKLTFQKRLGRRPSVALILDYLWIVDAR
jgi:hypothetical protein